MLSFSEWDKRHYSIDESLEDNVKNWLSRTFGGSIKKIDSILADLVFIEKKYVGEWEKAQRTIYDLRKQIESEDITPAEKKDFRNKIGNLKEELHEIYLQCSPRQNPDKIWETIHELLSPTNYGSSLIQSISRIKNRFKKQIPEVVYRSYTISGCRGKAYSIPFLKTMA